MVSGSANNGSPCASATRRASGETRPRTAAPATAWPASDSSRRASVSRASTALRICGLMSNNSPPRSGVKTGDRARSAVHQTTSRRLPAAPATSWVSFGRAPCHTSSTVTWGCGGAAVLWEPIFVRRALRQRDCGYYPTGEAVPFRRNAQSGLRSGSRDASPRGARRLGLGARALSRRSLLRAVPGAGRRGRFRGRLPERLQVVVGALARKEDVHDDAGIVEHDPRPLLVTGSPQRANAFRLNRLDDRVGDGAHLAVRVAFAHHEIIRDRALPPDIDPDDARSLLVRSRIRDEPAELKGRHYPDYPSYHARLSTPGLADVTLAFPRRGSLLSRSPFHTGARYCQPR